MTQKSFSIEEEYIVVSPQEAGEQQMEYCAQEQESRPKLLGFQWGSIVPVGRAVTSLLSNILDSQKDGSPGNANVTIDKASSTRHCECGTSDITKLNGQDSANSMLESTSKCDPHTMRRCSMKKMNAVSSFGEDTTYRLQKVKLNSRESSSEDYMILRVRTSSSSSLLSPTVDNRSLSDVTNCEGNDAGTVPVLSDQVEKDSPAHHRQINSPATLSSHTCTLVENSILNPGPENSSSDPGSALLLRRQSGMTDKKSYSLPSKTDFISPGSIVAVNYGDVTKSLPATNKSNGTPVTNGASSKTPTEEEIRKAVKDHCDEFVRFSDWTTLLPLLEKSDLLDPETREILMNPCFTSRYKGNYFYLKTLPSQGNSAYTAFYTSFMQESEHAGHKDLKAYLCPS